MKKLMLVAVSALFMVAGCEESKNETAVEQKPVAQQTVQQVDPQLIARTAPAEEKVAEIVTIDWAKALEMNKAGAVLIDVRTPGEVAEGMAPGAINIPLQEIQHRLNEFPKDKDLLIYCRSGKRSMVASDFLVKNGYDRVFSVAGGFLAFPKN